MEQYVLDTNLFFNMEAGFNIGSKTEEVVVRLTEAMKRAKQHGVRFLVPPRMVDEFLSFFEDKQQPFIQAFLSELTIQSPSIATMEVAASVVAELVEDVRQRNYRGMQIAEEEMKNVARTMMGQGELSKQEFEMKSGTAIKHFRERYRQATRFGFLDSLTDLDLILLAKETEGVLVSADEGLMKWGRKIGVKEMPLPAFGQKVREDWSA